MLADSGVLLASEPQGSNWLQWHWDSSPITIVQNCSYMVAGERTQILNFAWQTLHLFSPFPLAMVFSFVVVVVAKSKHWKLLTTFTRLFLTFSCPLWFEFKMAHPLHRLMCLNTWSPDGGPAMRSCETFQREGLARRLRSLRTGI